MSPLLRNPSSAFDTPPSEGTPGSWSPKCNPRAAAYPLLLEEAGPEIASLTLPKVGKYTAVKRWVPQNIWREGILYSRYPANKVLPLNRSVGAQKDSELNAFVWRKSIPDEQLGNLSKRPMLLSREARVWTTCLHGKDSKKINLMVRQNKNTTGLVEAAGVRWVKD